jgi:hypothetical protein
MSLLASSHESQAVMGWETRRAERKAASIELYSIGAVSPRGTMMLAWPVEGIDYEAKSAAATGLRGM